MPWVVGQRKMNSQRINKSAQNIEDIYGSGTSLYDSKQYQ